eukprot:COSAG06_NODE_22679_length_716_cov_0.828201_1_plen_68_part_10
MLKTGAHQLLLHGCYCGHEEFHLLVSGLVLCIHYRHYALVPPQRTTDSEDGVSGLGAQREANTGAGKE